MRRLIQIPPDVARVFGDAAPNFVDFLANVLSDQKEEVQQMSALSFERTLTREIASVRLEIADLRTETQTSIADLRADLKSDMHGQISGLHEKISDIHKQISNQTKWLLVMMLAAVTIYPIVNQLVKRFL